MSTITEYAEDRELSAMAERMITTFGEFTAIRENSVKVLCVMKICQDSETEESKPSKGAPVSLKRIHEAERVYIKGHAHYLLVMDWAFWNSADEIGRERAIHLYALKKIRAEKKDDKLKLSANPPDVVIYYDTATRYGSTMDELDQVHRCVAQSRRIVQTVQKLESQAAAEAAAPEAAAPKPKAASPVESAQEHVEGAENGAPAPEESDSPEPEEEPPLVEEEILPPPKRVNKRASKP